MSLDKDATPSTPDSSTAAAAEAPARTEDLVLAALKTRDLPSDEIERIAKDTALMKSRKVRLALAAHPRASRRLTLRLIRELYTFDLMQFSVMPAVAADLKRVAEEQLVVRLCSITLGERLSLARRSSTLVAGALLLDKESPVWQAALDNPRLTEAAIFRALQHPNAGAAFVEAVCHHAKWSVRSEIRLALLRNPHTPLARALEFARRLSPTQLRDVLHNSRLPEKTKAHLRKDLESRGRNC
ncbi:conserved hypothetical protein [Candidatus Sulfotelmatobacter kueseliae]|uniref:Leucine rich repeat variant n=1 Tax=Candidatus Sulfotelmatobacter kueseliae TaxID=2042962 RepID=A0A2U3L0Q1_9BACT|nr:conserved hypothetical protein [Candidatus Sulfotelmatobacter kueseliae]